MLRQNVKSSFSTVISGESFSGFEFTLVNDVSFEENITVKKKKSSFFLEYIKPVKACVRTPKTVCGVFFAGWLP